MITLTVSGLGPNLTVVPDLTPDSLGEDQFWALPFVQQLPGCCLGYGNWTVLKQVGLNEGDRALLVWCVLQWWLGQSAAGHHPGLLAWHWIGLVYQPNWWCLTAWTWHFMPHPSSVLLPTTTAHKTGWPDLHWSLQLLLGQLCHLKPCLQQLAPAMHEIVVVLLSHLQWKSPVFSENTKSQAG